MPPACSLCQRRRLWPDSRLAAAVAQRDTRNARCPDLSGQPGQRRPEHLGCEGPVMPAWYRDDGTVDSVGATQRTQGVGRLGLIVGGPVSVLTAEAHGV